MITPSPLNPTGAGERDPVRATAARLHALDQMQSLERLLESQDFKNYIAFFEGGIASLESQAKDIKGNDAGTRDAFSQRAYGMRDMLEWPTRQIAACRAIIRRIDEAGA